MYAFCKRNVVICVTLGSKFIFLFFPYCFKKSFYPLLLKRLHVVF